LAAVAVKNNFQPQYFAFSLGVERQGSCNA